MTAASATAPKRDDWNGIWLAAAIVAVLFAVTWLITPQQPAPAPLAPSAVMLSSDTGHGSGVYIGNGYVITAGQVASQDELALTVGSISTTATVLWVNKTYDVALLRTDAVGVAAAPLDCSPLAVGERLTARGNPLLLTDITTDLRVAGTGRSVGPWHNVVPVDGTIIPGVSGGPVYDTDGNVAGIVVGEMIQPIGMGSASGLGFIVPAETVCMLMGKA